MLVHSTPLAHALAMVPTPLVAVEIEGLARESGRRALRRAHEMISGQPNEEFLPSGGAADNMMRLADEHLADLIVTGAGQRKHGFTWMIGSVSRALALGANQSILLTKQSTLGTGLVHAVFATDHSDYANKALAKLLAWAPKGFSRIDVVTAYNVEDSVLDPFEKHPEEETKYEAWLKEHATKHSKSVANRLKEIAPETSYRVVKGEPNEVIHDAMLETGAELLIVGAQGHGVIERLIVGSVSLHQAFAEPYAVLMIRLPR